MKKYECEKCGKMYETKKVLLEDQTALCKDCIRKNGTLAYLVLAIIIACGGFIAGIALGASIPIVEVKSMYDDPVEHFNGLLMLYIWIATFFTSFFMFAIWSIIRRIDMLIDKK